jgi:hypothetical protein
VAYNRVAKSITGLKIRDRVSVPELLERAGIPSINGMVVNAIAIETWSCRHSSDGGNGSKNFVGSTIFDTGEAVKNTRAETAGMALVTLRGKETFVSHGVRTWNASEALREATSKSAARLAAKNLAARSPLLVPTTVTYSADPATETDDQTTEVADLATEVANSAREAADRTKEMTTCHGDQVHGHAHARPTTTRGHAHGNGHTHGNEHQFFSPVLGTVGIGALPIPVPLGYLPSAGTSLLDYKRGVTVARPHGS